MRLSLPSEDISGTIPDIEGRTCFGVMCQEYFHDGELKESANLVFLNFDARWFQLCFDHGYVFWRDSESPPTDHEAPEISASFKYVDLGKKLGLEGSVLTELELVKHEHKNSVTFRFENGVSLEIFGQFDDTSGWVAA